MLPKLGGGNGVQPHQLHQELQLRGQNRRGGSGGPWGVPGPPLPGPPDQTLPAASCGTGNSSKAAASAASRRPWWEWMGDRTEGSG